MEGMVRIEPKEIDRNIIDLIGKQWMLISAGSVDNHNTMTANWGAMGELWFKHVAMIFVRPQRYTRKFIDNEEVFTLSFLPDSERAALEICGTVSGRDVNKVKKAGLTPVSTELDSVAFREADMVIECRKLYEQEIERHRIMDKELAEKIYPLGDYHHMYIAEIMNVWIKEQNAQKAL